MPNRISMACLLAALALCAGCQQEVLPQIFAPMHVVDGQARQGLGDCLLVQERWERETFYGGNEIEPGEYVLKSVQLWKVTPNFVFHQPPVVLTDYPDIFVHTTVDQKYFHIVLKEGYAPAVLTEEQVADIVRQDKPLVVELSRQPAPPGDTRLEQPFYLLQHAEQMAPISDPLRKRLVELRAKCPGALPPEN